MAPIPHSPHLKSVVHVMCHRKEVSIRGRCKGGRGQPAEAGEFPSEKTSIWAWGRVQRAQWGRGRTGDWVKPIRLETGINYEVGHARIHQKAYQLKPCLWKSSSVTQGVASSRPSDAVGMWTGLSPRRYCMESSGWAPEPLGALEVPGVHTSSRPVKSESLRRDSDASTIKSSPGDTHIQAGLRM